MNPAIMTSRKLAIADCNSDLPGPAARRHRGQLQPDSRRCQRCSSPEEPTARPPRGYRAPTPYKLPRRHNTCGSPVVTTAARANRRAAHIGIDQHDPAPDARSAPTAPIPYGGTHKSVTSSPGNATAANHHHQNPCPSRVIRLPNKHQTHWHTLTVTAKATQTPSSVVPQRTVAAPPRPVATATE